MALNSQQAKDLTTNGRDPSLVSLQRAHVDAVLNHESCYWDQGKDQHVQDEQFLAAAGKIFFLVFFPFASTTNLGVAGLILHLPTLQTVFHITWSAWSATCGDWPLRLLTIW